MKILHYLKEIDLETGGVVRCVLDLCSGLAAAGHEVTLVTADGRDLPGAWSAGGSGMPRGVVVHTPRRPGAIFSRLHTRVHWCAYPAQVQSAIPLLPRQQLRQILNCEPWPMPLPVRLPQPK